MRCTRCVSCRVGQLERPDLLPAFHIDAPDEQKRANLSFARALRLCDPGMHKVGCILVRNRPGELPLVVLVGMSAPIVVLGRTTGEDLLQVVISSAVNVRLIDGVFVGITDDADFDIHGHICIVLGRSLRASLVAARGIRGFRSDGIGSREFPVAYRSVIGSVRTPINAAITHRFCPLLGLRRLLWRSRADTDESSSFATTLRPPLSDQSGRPFSYRRRSASPLPIAPRI